MAESERTNYFWIVSFAIVFLVLAAGFGIWRVVMPETQRTHVPIAAGATYAPGGGAWLTVRPGSGPVAAQGDSLRFEWQPLSRVDAASMTPSVREISRASLNEQQAGRLLASMKRGETRRVWVTRNLWYGSRIEAFDVTLVSVRAGGKEVAGNIPAAAD